MIKVSQKLFFCFAKRNTAHLASSAMHVRPSGQLSTIWERAASAWTARKLSRPAVLNSPAFLSNGPVMSSKSALSCFPHLSMSSCMIGTLSHDADHDQRLCLADMSVWTPRTLFISNIHKCVPDQCIQQIFHTILKTKSLSMNQHEPQTVQRFPNLNVWRSYGISFSNEFCAMKSHTQLSERSVLMPVHNFSKINKPITVITWYFDVRKQIKHNKNV